MVYKLGTEALVCQRFGRLRRKDCLKVTIFLVL